MKAHALIFYLTRKAKADLVGIAQYTQKRWGMEQRDAYLKQIDDAFHGIAEMPGKGRKCDYLRAGYRKLVVGKHLIFYRCFDAQQIEIVRILHGSMDIEIHLAEE